MDLEKKLKGGLRMLVNRSVQNKPSRKLGGQAPPTLP